uniref:Uncharacterized protein n=1 Tax=Clytia hemisphaerica TaxID=252671 RepID=A0A7M6DS08_9CNID
MSGDIVKGYSAPIAVNGYDHMKKKNGMWRILKRAEQKYGYEGLYKIMQKNWRFILPMIKDNQTNVDNLIDVFTVRTMTEFYFDKPFDLSPKVFLLWFLRGLIPKNKPNLKLDALGKQVTKQMYAYIDSTPWAKKVLPGILKEDGRGADTLKGEALQLAFIFSVFSLRSGLSSTIPYF